METITEAIAAVPFWYHSLDLGVVTTDGVRTATSLAREANKLTLPDLTGKSVLDIGAWDGFFSFEAERRGARRVVALDHYVWSLDLRAFMEDGPSRDRGILPEHTEHWQPSVLPGKRGFDVAHRALSSQVESVAEDFMEVDLARLGTFDVVLYLGVLYHMRHPLAALERLAAVTGELAVIETEAIGLPLLGDLPFCEFFEGREMAGDASNWWSPTLAALEGMCRAAGFREVRTIVGPSLLRSIAHSAIAARKGSKGKTPRSNGRPLYRYRALVHALK